MTLPRVLCLLLALAVVPLALADVGIGDSREEVIRQAGQPTSRAKRGDREIFLYAHGARVEFIDDKVADVKGPLPTAAPEPAGAPSAESAVPAPAAPASAVSIPSAAKSAAPAKPSPTATTTSAAKATAPKPAAPAAADAEYNPAAASDALAKHVEKMDTAWGERPAAPDLGNRFSWPKLLVSLVLHFGITLLALKIAFKVEEMDALWSGTLAIAGIDAAIYGTLEALGPLTNGLSAMGAVESGIGALVMIFTIQKFCINKRLQNAIVTAMSVKLIVRLCHMFLFVLLLNAIFG